MQGDRVCEKCGQLIPRGSPRCPVCADPLGFSARRETMLLICFALLAVLFGVTGVLVKQYHARERSLARQWHSRGEQKLRQGDPAGAAIDFRTALFHFGSNQEYQLQLAQSLVASGHDSEARSYLVRLWEENPASGPVNLNLALLAEREADVPQVISYYHNAIDGVWPEGARVDLPRELRKQLCEYLIDHGHHTEALAELIELSSQTPDDAPLLAQVGSLFLKAQDYDSALKEFQRSLRRNRRPSEAWAGAGKSEFRLGNYRAARIYLAGAVARNRQDSESAQLLAAANQTLDADPFDRRVPAQTRRRRAINDFQYAANRLADCLKSQSSAGAAPPDLQSLLASAQKLKPQMRESAMRRDPDLLDAGMGLTWQIEGALQDRCGPLTSMDRALLLIGRRNGAVN